MSKKRSVRYICPCCYGNIDLSQIHYSCSNPECAPTFLERCNASERRRYGSQYKPYEEIDVERSEYLEIEPRSPEAITTKNHIIRSTLNGSCDICKNKNTTKLCPVCHEPITNGADVNGTTIYMVLGSEGVGKSHYLASLIRVMEDSLADEMKTSFRCANEKTSMKFDKEYRNTVYVEGKCLPPTPTYGEKDTRKPLLYYYGDDNSENAKTIAFIDTSGDDLDYKNSIAYMNISRSLAGASGVMFLVDPLQLPAVRSKLGLPTSGGQFKDVADTLHYISDIIRDENKIRPKADINIPLAIILTKTDLILRAASGSEDEDALFGPESSLHIAREEGIVDAVNINQIGTEVEEYLRRNAGQEFIDEVEKYPNHQFFAVSAIGSDPVEGKLIKGVAPYRVEDPIIWSLNNNARRRWF